MQSKRLVFRGATGEALAARLDVPVDEEPVAYALFAHCFTCSKNLNAVVNISRALNRARIAVLRFDFTGLGESEGDFAGTNFSSNVSDLVAAAEFLGGEYQPPEILIGHSLGGAAVLQAAARIPSARAVATLGAPYDPADVTHLLRDSEAAIRAEGEAEVQLAGRRFRIRKQFLDDLEGVRMRGAIHELRRALLVFHAPRDEVVGIRNAAEIFQAARHPKSFVSLDQADHLLTDEEDSRYVGTVLAAWAGKYIEGSKPPTAEELVSEDRVVVRTGRTRYRTEIMANGHALVADEPVAVGGADTGPTPYDLLVAALGACTGMTLRMYAERKGWPLEEAVVRLRHRKVHAADEERCEAQDARLDQIERELQLAGPLDDEQRERLMEIADRCPVHRTLTAGVRVKTRLEDASGGGE
ncbi:bifunctional alpha/beta hydrolase/OsmC family protein [soil metagenome]